MNDIGYGRYRFRLEKARAVNDECAETAIAAIKSVSKAIAAVRELDDTARARDYVKSLRKRRLMVFQIFLGLKFYKTTTLRLAEWVSSRFYVPEGYIDEITAFNRDTEGQTERFKLMIRNSNEAIFLMNMLKQS